MKILINLSLVFFMMLISSCSFFNKNDDIIKKQKFIEVLTDIHMADATLTVKGYHINKDTVEIEKYYGYLLGKHNVTPIELKKTFEYYSKHTEQYDKIYDEVLNNLAKKESELDVNAEKEAKPQVKDLNPN